MNPQFYIKYVAEKYGVYHRLSHAYIATVETIAELKELLAELAAMEQRELYEFLMFERNAKIPPKRFAEKMDEHTADQERWYRQAWSIFTEKFYAANPSLLVEEAEAPYEVIQKIRSEFYANQRREEHARQVERERAVAAYQEESAEAKGTVHHPAKLPDGTMGSDTAIERLAREKRKGKKKLKVKAKSGKQAVIIDSTDLFA